MASDREPDVLRADLATLGRALRGAPAPESVVTGVMARLPDPLPPARRASRRPRPGLRRVLVAVVVVLLSLLAVPPVRAALADRFSFLGVDVHVTGRPAPSPSTPPAPSAPSRSSGLTLGQARALVDFTPVTVPALGPPRRVEVSGDRRVLSLVWDAEPAVRLDEYADRLDDAFAKTADDVRWVEVGGETALWFDRPYAVVLLDAAGRARTDPPRLAGRTLVWEHAGTVLRLEGDVSLEAALRTAASVRPAG